MLQKNLKPGEEITTNYRMQPELEQPEDFMRKRWFCFKIA